MFPRQKNCLNDEFNQIIKKLCPGIGHILTISSFGDYFFLFLLFNIFVYEFYKLSC